MISPIFDILDLSLHQWSTEPKQDSVLFGIQFGSFRKTRTEYLQDKIKDERILRSFLEKFFLKMTREVS